MVNKIVLAALLFLSACSNRSLVSERDFGRFEGKSVKEYTIMNSAGMLVSVINYGGTLTKLIVPDKNDNPGDVILGFESLSGYLQKGEPYFGALIGRYANRIAHAKFSLGGKNYTLAANDHGNSLHGGLKGFDKVFWNIRKTSDSSLELTYHSKDTEEGYPGNLDAEITYTLTSYNALKIDYYATTDKATPVNLTNHAYFNLSAGNDSTILNEELWIKATQYTPVDSLLIPTGQIVKVNPFMDFTVAKKIGRDIDSVRGGYDHNWVLDKAPNQLEKVASLYDPESGRFMEVFTTEPGLQFYSGNFLDGTLTNTKGHAKYVKHGALCLEAQHFPNSPNQPNFPSTILYPNRHYEQTTIYKFSVK